MIISLTQIITLEKETINTLNHLGSQRSPFFFVIDFEKKQPWIRPLSKLDKQEVLFDINGFSNFLAPDIKGKQLEFNIRPVNKNSYKKSFEQVQQHIKHGNTFLLNLTMPSRVTTNFSLKEIFFQSKARYKLWFRDQFVVFSPEIFIRTRDNKISSFPMKGTIDAAVPDAEKQLLQSEKELAEHYTIVDLIRNDLSMVAKNVQVDKFRYIDHIKTHHKNLLQMSSKITGELEGNWQNRLGDILMSMLPAGSISGAPKKKTLEIIHEAEHYKRGYYTGIFGVFNGRDIDSGVMIRYIEKTDKGLIYKSGGGITSKSNFEEEYRELIDKIYVPF
jgi:para-aminobenzoate synthetase component 1